MTPRLMHLCLVGMCLLAPLGAQTPACPDSDAEPEVTEGLNDLRQGEFAKATEHFHLALQVDADCVNARIYLATAYLQQYVPGGKSPENQAFADQAREQFEKVLEQQPDNETAMVSIASLYLNQKKLDDAKVWYEKLTVLNPENKLAFYTLGVIAWTRSFYPDQEARAKAGMKPEDAGPLKDADARQALRSEFLPVIQDGIDNLKRALEIDGDYDDAMAYLNLLYRTKADLAEAPEEYKADMAQAQEWVQRGIDTKKNKASRRQ